MGLQLVMPNLDKITGDIKYIHTYRNKINELNENKHSQKLMHAFKQTL